MQVRRPRQQFYVVILLLLSFSFGSIFAAHSSPAPTVGRIMTSGDLGPCDYFIYLDGITPVALFESHKGGTPGDNIVGTAGQDIATFLNPLTVANVEFCFSAQTFTISTSWILAQSDSVIGQFNSTLFQAAADSFDMISVIHPAVGGTPTRNLLVSGLSFSANSHIGLVGINLNQSLNEVSSNNIVEQLWFNGLFTYLAIMDGNEASPLRDVYCGNTCGGDISDKVFNGASEIINIQYMNPAGTGNRIHLLASQFLIDQSTFDGIQFEGQMGGQNGGAAAYQTTSGDIMISNSFLANADPNGMHRIITRVGQQTTVLSLTLLNNEIFLNKNGALFAAYNSANSKLAINNLALIGNHIFQTSSTAYWAVTNSSATITMKYYHWDPSNTIAGTITATGGLASSMTTGVCSTFFFAPQPTAFNGPVQNFPALPVGTGSANARQNCLPYPMTVYMNVTSSGGTILQTGLHVIDVLISNTDKNMFNIQTVTLYPGDKIYFATNVPYAWDWYGDQW